MGHNDFHLRVAGQHITGNHVGHGTGGFREVLLHGEWRLLHHLAVDGIGTVGMQDDDGMALVEHREQGVEFGRAQVLAIHVGC